MTSPEAPPSGPSGPSEPPPATPHWLQRLMDNPWALLVLGVGIPTVSYSVWGWLELVLIAPARLP